MLDNLEKSFGLLGRRLVVVRETAPALFRGSTVNWQQE